LAVVGSLRPFGQGGAHGSGVLVAQSGPVEGERIAPVGGHDAGDDIQGAAHDTPRASWAPGGQVDGDRVALERAGGAERPRVSGYRGLSLGQGGIGDPGAGQQAGEERLGDVFRKAGFSTSAAPPKRRSI
jgi:hypothetical protein